MQFLLLDLVLSKIPYWLHLPTFQASTQPISLQYKVHDVLCCTSEDINYNQLINNPQRPSCTSELGRIDMRYTLQSETKFWSLSFVTSLDEVVGFVVYREVELLQWPIPPKGYNSFLVPDSWAMNGDQVDPNGAWMQCGEYKLGVAILEEEEQSLVMRIEMKLGDIMLDYKCTKITEKNYSGLFLECRIPGYPEMKGRVYLVKKLENTLYIILNVFVLRCQFAFYVNTLSSGYLSRVKTWEGFKETAAEAQTALLSVPVIPSKRCDFIPKVLGIPFTPLEGATRKSGPIHQRSIHVSNPPYTKGGRNVSVIRKGNDTEISVGTKAYK